MAFLFWRKLCRALWLSVLAVMIASPAWARDERKAKKLYNEGVTLFNNKQFSEARTKFGEAYELDPSPVLIFNQARSSEEMGDVLSTSRFYTVYLYLETNLDQENRNEIQRWIDAYNAYAQKLPANPESEMASSLVLKGLSSPTLLHEMALKSEASGDFEEALQYYRAYLEQAPESKESTAAKTRFRILSATLEYTKNDQQAFLQKSSLREAQSKIALASNEIMLDSYRRESFLSRFTTQEIVGISLGVGGLVAAGFGTYFYASSWGDKDDAEAAGKKASQFKKGSTEYQFYERQRNQYSDDMTRHAVMGYIFWGIGATALTGGCLLWWFDHSYRKKQTVQIYPLERGAGLQVQF